MTNALNKINYYFEQGQKALADRNYRFAAEMFKKSYELYEDAELPLFSARIRDIGNEAFEKYNLIVSKYLNEDGFNEIQYEK